MEPLLSAVDLERELGAYLPGNPSPFRSSWLRKLNWVVAGGESGPDARPMYPDWVRSIRDQCTAAGVPFFFKQWGEWAPVYDEAGMLRSEGFGKADGAYLGQRRWVYFEAGECHGDVFKLGKQKAGRTLDGRTWDEMPK